MDPRRVGLRSGVCAGYNGIKKEGEKMEVNIKGKSGMVVEWVIKDKDGNIKEQGVDETNGNINE